MEDTVYFYINKLVNKVFFSSIVQFMFSARPNGHDDFKWSLKELNWTQEKGKLRTLTICYRKIESQRHLGWTHLLGI